MVINISFSRHNKALVRIGGKDFTLSLDRDGSWSYDAPTPDNTLGGCMAIALMSPLINMVQAGFPTKSCGTPYEPWEVMPEGTANAAYDLIVEGC